MGIAVVAAAAGASSSMAFLRTRAQRAKWILTPLASSSFSGMPISSSASSSRKLVLYSKPGCCLCDGLKEKLQAAFMLSGSDSLHDVELQVVPSLSFILSFVSLFELFWVIDFVS